MRAHFGHWATSVAAMLLACAVAIDLPQAFAQKSIDEAQRRADVDLSAPVDPVTARPDEAKTEPAAQAKPPVAEPPAEVAPVVEFKRLQLSDIDMLALASPKVSGVFMYPIYALALVVAMCMVERGLTLRRLRIVPPRFVEGIKGLSSSHQSFDVHRGYALCKQFPSAAGSVVRAMLLKMGRPQAEVELAIAVATKREALSLRQKTRPFKFAASASPMLGLLGTVQGVILAFYATAHLPDSSDKAQSLAAAMCVAFVPTFVGLAVGFISVCLFHYFAGKVHRFMAEIDDLACSLLAELQVYEGKVRVSRQVLNGTTEGVEKNLVTNRLSE